MAQLFQFLTEGEKANAFIKQYKKALDALLNRLDNDDSFDAETIMNPQLQKKLSEIEDEEQQKVEYLREVLSSLETQYPTIKSNLPWVLKQYTSENFLWEDMARVEDDLKKIKRMGQLGMLEPDEKNIQEYSYDKFIEVLRRATDDALMSANEKKKRRDASMNATADEETGAENKDSGIPDVDIVYNDSELIVYHPHTWEAERALIPASYNGKVRRWCTAGSNDHYFNSYSSQGPLFPMLLKDIDEWYQLHFETGSFLDLEDNRPPKALNEFIKDHPSIGKFIKYWATQNWSILKNSSRKLDINWEDYVNWDEVPEEFHEWLKYPGDDSSFLQQKNSKAEVLPRVLQEQFINKNPMNVKAMLNVPVDLQMKAVKMNIDAWKRSCPKEIRDYVLEQKPVKLQNFTEYNTMVDGKVVTVKTSDYITVDDIKKCVAKVPGLFVMLVVNENFKPLIEGNTDLIKFVLNLTFDEKVSGEGKGMLDLLLYADKMFHIPDDIKLWYYEEKLARGQTLSANAKKDYAKVKAAVEKGGSEGKATRKKTSKKAE